MSDVLDLLDVDHRAALELIPKFDFGDLPKARAGVEAMIAAGNAIAPAISGVIVEDRFVPGPKGGADVMLRIYRPKRSPGHVPLFYWIHGGGLIVGLVAMDDVFCKNIVKSTGCVV